MSPMMTLHCLAASQANLTAMPVLSRVAPASQEPDLPDTCITLAISSKILTTLTTDCLLRLCSYTKILSLHMLKTVRSGAQIWQRGQAAELQLTSSGLRAWICMARKELMASCQSPHSAQAVISTLWRMTSVSAKPSLHALSLCCDWAEMVQHRSPRNPRNDQIHPILAADEEHFATPCSTRSTTSGFPSSQSDMNINWPVHHSICMAFVPCPLQASSEQQCHDDDSYTSAE